MGFFSSHFKKLDWGLVISAVLIVGFGLTSIYSASLPKNNFLNFEKQFVFFAAGFVLMLLISFFDYRVLRNNSYSILTLYFICLLLLAGLFVFAPEIRGTKGWYKVGLFSFDPIEPTKLVLIILLAKYFSMRHVEMYKFRHIVFSGFYVFLPSFLIFLKPDLGGVMILLSIWFGILLISGIKVKHFLILFLCFLTISGLAWSFLLKDYQKDRILSFIFPYDVLGGSWSQTQSKIAVGSGMILGQGVGRGSQVQYGFLPEPHTDFIFSVMAEEWGFLGISVFFLLYINLIWRIIKIAIDSETNFPRLFASGFAIILIAQFVINIGMNLSMLPVVGIYLPLVSYGGSGLIGTFVGLGVLQSIKARR